MRKLTVVSGPKDSGSMEQYSPWYQLCSPDLKPGERIVSHSFSLRGDRKCGSWAECKLLSESSDQVCYEFRMQGHNEGGTFFAKDDGVKQSEGVLVLEID